MDLSQFLKILQEPISQDFTAKEWLSDVFQSSFQAYFNDLGPDSGEQAEFFKPYLGSGPFLDLGCGQGQLSALLSKTAQGLGLDLEWKHLSGTDFLGLQGDLRHLPVQGKFSLILLSFGQFCLMSKPDALQLLKNLKKHLQDDGCIYLDLPTIEWIQELGSGGEWEQEEKGSLFMTRQWDVGESIFSQRMLRVENAEISDRMEFSYQLYSLYELLEMFKDLRYKLVYGCEDLEHSPIQETSQWMIFVLRKN